MKISLNQYLDSSQYKLLTPLDFVKLKEGMVIFDNHSNCFKKIVSIDRSSHTITKAEQDYASDMVLDKASNIWTKIPNPDYTDGKTIPLTKVVFRNTLNGSGLPVKKGSLITFSITDLFRYGTYLVDDAFIKKFLVPVNTYVSYLLDFKKQNNSLISPVDVAIP